MILLDIGGGNQPHLEPGYDTVATDRHDFSKDYVGKKNCEFVVHDILTPLPFSDKSIDKIWCHHCLEHLPHQLPSGKDALVFAVNEMGRVIKPGCEVHLIAPWVEHTNAWRHPGHYRYFNYDIFNWFDHRNDTPDHEAYGYVNKMELVNNWIQDNCHVYAIFKGL